MKAKITRLYKRGQVYWYAYQLNGCRRFHSLDTTEEDEAIQKILQIQYQPDLIESDQWSLEVKNYLKNQQKAGRLSRFYAQGRGYVLERFARDNQIHNPREVTSYVVQRWYNSSTDKNPQTANHYLIHLYPSGMKKWRKR